MKKTFPYLIVGQGIAGSVLAFTFFRRAIPFSLVDLPVSQASSRVAAGLFTPITGQRMVKTWKADQIFPFLHHFYAEMQDFFQKKFFFPLPIYRPFDSVEKQNQWLAESAEPALRDFVNTNFDTQLYEKAVYQALGGLQMKQSGYLNVPEMLETMRIFLEQNQLLISAKLEEKDIILEEKGIFWKNETYQKIIFCRGMADGESPFFDFLPFRPTKGETLTVKLLEGKIDHIISRNGWILPLSSGLYKVGATYDWHDRTEIPTENARKELCEKLDKLIRLPYEIVRQEAGIRPTTIDRRPFIGISPKNDNVLIFNGLGTKGVSLAPFWATHLADFLEGKNGLDGEVDVRRFLRK